MKMKPPLPDDTERRAMYVAACNFENVVGILKDACTNSDVRLEPRHETVFGCRLDIIGSYHDADYIMRRFRDHIHKTLCDGPYV